MTYSSKDESHSTNINRLSFTAEWYQEEAGIVRLFLIYFYPSDQSLEVFEHKSKKTFLRRTRMPEITVKDFFIGSNICVFGRQFDIVGFGDEMTKNSLAKFRTRTFMLLKPSITHQLGVILTYILESDARISEGMMVKFTPDTARAFVGDENRGDDSRITLMNDLLTGQSVGFVVIADNILNQLKACQDQSKESFNSDVYPSLRKLFEEENFRRGIYCSPTEADANRDIGFFFNQMNVSSLEISLQNTTLAVIKPHAIKEANLGHIISEIVNRGFKINVLKMQILERVNCEEFYEVYRGILPEYIPMVAELASGVCMALEIGSKDESLDTYKEFREFCGPMDPEVAKLLRPNSLRAKFGTSKVKNAIHCTDLKEDTVLEIQYFFKILTES
ncbi:nucleoside diphosphate kinase 7 [Episyrphus balteatus]|uniref:nucleoside diphosphate kinase 7 n=1 Tax=Episyrphus balteatus TaxID=286459 RepID=UPI002485C614|nr:nucleoside diphosphate kinase 7 [Episyrphus balteatus]